MHEEVIMSHQYRLFPNEGSTPKRKVQRISGVISCGPMTMTAKLRVDNSRNTRWMNIVKRDPLGWVEKAVRSLGLIKKIVEMFNFSLRPPARGQL